MQENNKRLNIVLWAFYIVFMMLSEVLTCKSFPWWDAPISIMFNILLYGVLFWELCLLISLCNNVWQRILHCLLHFVVIAYTSVNVFLVLAFHRHIDAYILEFVKETNTKEAGEFFSAYIISPVSLFLLLGIVAILVLEIYLFRKVKPVNFLPKSKWLKSLIILFAIAMSSNIVFFLSSNADTNYDRAAGTPIKRNGLWTLRQSLLQYGEFSDEYDECARTLAGYDEKLTQNNDSVDFVLVIGESFNKHVSNLYGSKYNTNPLLNRYLKDRSLVLFKDVIACANGTTQNFKAFLSMASVNDRRSWCSMPLFPIILRHAGYNVVFYSNQFVRNDNLGQWDHSMGFFNDPRIEPYLFSNRNEKTYEYDMGLVENYAENRSSLEKSRNNFIIFHLYGQHVRPEQRYPKGYGHFCADNVNRKGFAREENKMFAEYLNATEYNDMVVDSIIHLFEHRNAIILYFSDHGEEIYNFRNQMGRTDLSTDCKEALHCQLDVPFMMYFTRKYQATHKDVCERVRHAAQRPFMTDDLPHVILDVLSVKSKWFDPRKSVINDNYDVSGRRTLLGGRVYEK